MIRRFLITVLFAGIFLPATAQQTKHVLLISIDGFRPDFYRNAGWETPNLRKLAAEGVSSAGINSVFPSVTYPSHTSIITGALPARHGIYFNAPYGDTTGHWYWEEERIEVPTLWDAVRKKGWKSGSVLWPVSVGAPVDYNFPVRGADDAKDGRWAAMKPLVSPGLLKEIDENFPIKEADLDYNRSVDETVEKVAALIIEKHQPTLLTVHFVTADHMQHELGREHPEVKKTVHRIDSLIGQLIAQLD
ncbi:MAG: alkaline phosphatase family protein, partial [Mucilaginibacter polytrichastri]|nr:alkaline phosphatase family protein [Mucilaginibacter polytrichastri]